MPDTALEQVPLWINGEKRYASNQETFEVRNPYSQKVVTVSVSASSQDCKEAIDAAGRAQASWESTSSDFKRDIFLKAAELLQTEKYKRKAMEAIQEETACIESWGNLNIFASVALCRKVASQASEIKDEEFPSIIPGGRVVVQKRAYDVALSIAPWNAPLNLSFRAIAMPLICGNTVVLKSSECSPRSQEIAVEVMHEAGIPPGVLNYVSMSRESAPKLTAEMIAHPLIRHINFTGSDRVGRIIASQAAQYLKPCVFELGGKAPVIVLDDANIKSAARAIASGAMMHSGQICMSTERVIAQRGVAKELTEGIKSAVQKLRAGDTQEDGVKIGALFREDAAENVLEMVKEAQKGGAELLLGDLKREGSVVRPHILKNVGRKARLWNRESFGPVIVIAEVDTVDEAVESANASEYSLVAALWTQDITTGIKIASRIRAGSTSINGQTVHSEPTIGGNAGLGGASGYGRFDINNFTAKCAIVVHPPDQVYPFVDE